MPPPENSNSSLGLSITLTNTTAQVEQALACGFCPDSDRHRHSQHSQAEASSTNSLRVPGRLHAVRVHFGAQRFQAISQADQHSHHAERRGPAQQEYPPHARVQLASIADHRLRMLRAKPPDRKIDEGNVQSGEYSEDGRDQGT